LIKIDKLKGCSKGVLYPKGYERIERNGMNEIDDVLQKIMRDSNMWHLGDKGSRE